MYKHLLNFAIVLGFASTGFAQDINRANCRDGEDVEYCLQHTKKAQLIDSNSPIYQKYLEKSNSAEESNKKPGKTEGPEKGVVYTIPVVFHILHNNGVENVSDEQAFDALAILNRDYRKLNADASSVQSIFAGIVADVEIEFAMATKAPDGTCFNGITRTETTATIEPAGSWSNPGGYQQVQAVVDGNDVYQGVWPHNKYLNIYVCKEIGGAAGYTFKPSGDGSASEFGMYFNGIFILHDYFGSIGTASVYTSRALTHEVGHWLNLSHTWGDNNDPGAGSCSGGGATDNVNDTPPCLGATACSLTRNSCSNDVSASGGYYSTDVIDNIENYMEYSYCSKMFTEGQKTRMRNAVTSSTAGRNNVISASNLLEVGVTNPEFCVVNFTASKTSICSGDQIQFSDESFNNVVGWTWSFPGGVPASSTDENPLVTYSTPGVYEVSLTATDGGTDLTETKTAFITVSSPSSIPFVDGFESYTTFDGINEWTVLNPGSNSAWALTTTAGHTGTKSAKLQNFGQTGENHDELIAASVDLSSITDLATFSFRYAYRKRNTGDNERLEAHFSYDCGDQWQQRKTIVGSSLSPLTSTTSWTPSSIDDWTTVHVNITNLYWVSNFRYKFEFEGNGGNNVYIDNINIYAGGPSDDIIDPSAGIGELESLKNLSLYPNPTENELNLGFSVDNNEDVLINIMDLSGKVVYTQFVKAAPGSNLVMMDTNPLANGIYMVNVKTMQGSKALRFVKQ